MAIYHFSVKIIGRSSGRSSTAAAAYRAGINITDERTGEIFQYKNKQSGVLDHAILTPARAPDWAKESASLWNAVETFENRKNSQLSRENVVALPHELTLEQNRELLHGFVEEAYVKRGMVAQIDIHAPDKKGNNKNIHAHIMLTTRQITRNGFKNNKPRNWNEKQTLREWRELWAVHMNRALELAGKKERVDSRSFKDQGIDDKEPSIHMGVEATAMERRGDKSRQGDKNRVVEAANKAFSNLKADKAVLDLQIKAEKKKQAYKARRKLSAKNHRKFKENRLNDIAKAKAKALGEDRAAQRSALSLKHRDEKHAFESRADKRRLNARVEVEKFIGTQRAKEEFEASLTDLNAKQSIFNRITGRTNKAADKLESARLNLEDAQTREKEWIGRSETQIISDRMALETRQTREGTFLLASFEKADKAAQRHKAREESLQPQKTPKRESAKAAFDELQKTKKARKTTKEAERNAGRGRERGFER